MSNFRPLRVSVPLIARMAFYGTALCVLGPIDRFVDRLTGAVDRRAERAVHGWDDTTP